MSNVKLQLRENTWYNPIADQGWSQELLSRSRVLVVGAGALGNEVLKNLALLGFGHITVMDFDNIEYANLSRSILYRGSDCGKENYKAEVAARRLQEINPNVQVRSIVGDVRQDLGLGVLRRMDVVIGCLDNRLARLYINRLCHRMGIPWVDGAIERMAGLLNVYVPGQSCYECQLTPEEEAYIRVQRGCPDVAIQDLVQGRVPTSPLAASIIGAMQVQEALKLLPGSRGRSLARRSIYLEGMSGTFIESEQIEPRSACASHQQIGQVIAAPLGHRSTIAETFDWLAQHFPASALSLQLRQPVVRKLGATVSQAVYRDLLIPKTRLSAKFLRELLRDPQDELRILPEDDAELSFIDRSFPQQELPLSALGIPELDIITVAVDGAPRHIELSLDEDSFWGQISANP